MKEFDLNKGLVEAVNCLVALNLLNQVVYVILGLSTINELIC